MKIPSRLQIFGEPVILSDVDASRLSVYLVGFMHLATPILTINEPDVKRLIVMELLGKRRWKLLERLIMRLGRMQRQALEKRVRKLL